MDQDYAQQIAKEIVGMASTDTEAICTAILMAGGEIAFALDKINFSMPPAKVEE